jgi:dTDP-4-dehydrorhamnose 3,5-epimerase
VKTIETHLDGPILVAPTIHKDARGYFLETYRRGRFAELGIEDEWVQDNHSRSARGVVRGIHYQPGMAKLIRCARGAIVDVLVDLRRGSPSFREWEAFTLDDGAGHQLYCPDGFGHAFCAVSEVADVVYKCSAYYDASAEGGIAFDDPDIGIAWPADVELRPSERDASAPRLAEVAESLPFGKS